jgi:selT/selW/selH-like putative selenoprotein
MGDELKKNLGAEIELIAGSNGVFDITVDGRMIYSKFEQGRFPQSQEIINRIREGRET